MAEVEDDQTNPASFNGSDIVLDESDGDEELPPDNPFDFRSDTARVVPVFDRPEDLDIASDDAEDIQHRNNEKQVDRFSIIKDTRKEEKLADYRHRNNSQQSPLSDEDEEDESDSEQTNNPTPNPQSNHISNGYLNGNVNSNGMSNAYMAVNSNTYTTAKLNGNATNQQTSNSAQSALDIPTASLQNSQSSSKPYTLGSLANIPFSTSNSPNQFTLTSLAKDQNKSKSKLGTIAEKQSPSMLGTAKLADISSASLIGTQQTSAFDIVNLDNTMSVSRSLKPATTNTPSIAPFPAMQVTALVSNSKQNASTSAMVSADDEDTDHEEDNGGKLRPNEIITSDLPVNPSEIEHGVSQEQVKVLQARVQELSHDHRRLKEELMRVFQQKGGVTPYNDQNGHQPASTPSMSSRHQTFHEEPIELSISAINGGPQFLYEKKYKYDVAFIVSQPLLHSTGAKVLDVEPLNSEDEEKAIQESFAGSGRKINYIRKFATVNNLRQLVTAGTRIIHYCGHGIPKALIFESDMSQQIGMSHRLSANHLRKLISAGGAGLKNNKAADTNLSLVFVSACHSEDAGKAFINAGAEHVVAVKRSAEMHDIAAGTFTKQFYFALVNGKTVKQAFDIAAETIKLAFVENNYLKNEAAKFVLLPKKAKHDIVLFEKPPSDLVIDQQKGSNFIDHTAKRGKKKFPQPPIGEWVGRFKEIHDLMHNILSDRLIIISCDKGLGKTAMLCRTLHYLWDRSLLTGIYYFDIYNILKKHPSLSIAEIVTRDMFPHLSTTCRSGKSNGKRRNTKRNVTNKQLIEAIHEESSNNKDIQYLIVFEDIDLFEYEHLAEDQRIDLFIEELIATCDNIKLLLTLGTPVNQCSFLTNMDKRIITLKPMDKESSSKLLEMYLSKHFSMNKIRNVISVEKIAGFCKGYPSLIKYAASRFQNDDDLENLNLRKQLKEEVANEKDKLEMTRYWKELSLERGQLRIGEIKQRIRQRDGQQLWEEMYGYRSRGLLNTLLYRMKEWYRDHVGDSQFKSRPIWTYYELEFIQMELLPFLAKQTKQTFKAPKEVVKNLETMEIDLNNTNHDNNKDDKKKKKWYNKLGRKKKKSSNNKDKNDKTKPFGDKQRSYNGQFEDDEKISEEEKVPIEVFAEFYKYWKELWKTMMEPKISPFYFKKDDQICLIAGMMKKERALSIIGQYARGTFLIRFSKQNPASLVLVVSTGPDQKPSQHKIHINKNIDDGTVTFEYQTVRKGIHRSSSLYDLFNHLQFLEHLWYRRRGKDQDYIEKDKRKILKYFKSRHDVWKL